MCAVICALSAVSCSTTTNSNAIARPQDVVNVKLRNGNNEIMAYADFEAITDSPSRRSAKQLFHKILPEADINAYGVELIEIDVDVSNKSKHGSATTFTYDFVSKDKKYQKPTLTISYIAVDQPGYEADHCQIAAVVGFRQKRELAMVQKNYSDAIATFKTKEFGPELQYVVRAIDGGNISALIRFSDNLDATQISKDEMIARIQKLTKNDIFPLELVRYKVQEDLRNADVQLCTLLPVEGSYIACDACELKTREDPNATHIGIKTDKEMPVAKCVVQRPLLSSIVEERECAFKANEEFVFCLKNKYSIPGEFLSLSVQDANGNELCFHSFTPNPVEAKSTVDQACITATMLGFNSYLITAKNLDEPIMFESRSGNEMIKNCFKKFDKTTKFVYSPGVTELDGGVGYITFIRMSGEVLKMALPWGTEIGRLISNNQKILVSSTNGK